MCVSVVGCQVQPGVPGIGDVEPDVQCVVARETLSFAEVDGAVLLAADAAGVSARSCSGIAEVDVSRAKTVDGIEGIKPFSLRARIFDGQEDVVSKLTFEPRIEQVSIGISHFGINGWKTGG